MNNSNYFLKIGAKKYKLIFTNHKEDKILQETEEANGYIQYDISEIKIRNTNSPDVIKETILHELLHALLDNSGIEDVNNDKIINILTPRIHAFFEDNREFLIDFIKHDFIK